MQTPLEGVVPQKKEHSCRRCGSPSDKRPGINTVYFNKLPLSVDPAYHRSAKGWVKNCGIQRLKALMNTLLHSLVPPLPLSLSPSLSPSSLSLPHDCPPEAATLEAGAREYLHSFLQCSVLFFQSLTGIQFTSPSDGMDTRVVFLVQSYQ